MVFANYEVPVAYSMVALATQSSPSAFQPFQNFMCYWTAFNNIYVTIAQQKGRQAGLRTRQDGTIRTRSIGSVNVPMVEPVSEREYLDLAFAEFGDDLKHRLIIHSNTEFFVKRIPVWHGQEIEFDGLGQRLNGVLNVGHTTDSRYPVWSPIDTKVYEQYIHGNELASARDMLSKQVLNMLYTVRNNTFHGGKRADDANDCQVVAKALPLLEMIVEAFLHK